MNVGAPTKCRSSDISDISDTLRHFVGAPTLTTTNSDINDYECTTESLLSNECRFPCLYRVCSRLMLWAPLGPASLLLFFVFFWRNLKKLVWTENDVTHFWSTHSSFLSHSNNITGQQIGLCSATVDVCVYTCDSNRDCAIHDEQSKVLSLVPPWLQQNSIISPPFGVLASVRQRMDQHWPCVCPSNSIHPCGCPWPAYYYC